MTAWCAHTHRGMAMPIDEAKIAQMQKDLDEAKAQLLAEDGQRYRTLRDHIGVEKVRELVDGLQSKSDRILFGLDLPEEPKQAKSGRRAKGKGTIQCPYCPTKVNNEKGLAIHIG